MTAIRVLIVESKGSVPRPAGVSMLVFAERIEGTIGGGALEWQAMAAAREMLQSRELQAPDLRAGELQSGELRTGELQSGDLGGRVMRCALGPQLGQCCGGQVTLLLEPHPLNARLDAPRALPELRPVPDLRPVLAEASAEPPAALKRLAMKLRSGQLAAPAPKLEEGWLFEPPHCPPAPVWIWGAGHVGRAVVDVLAPLPDLALTWVDFARDRFPETLRGGVDPVIAALPASLIPRAPREAHHLILTHSHALDLELCHGLLRHGFASAGLIGATTKARRFHAKLRDLGHTPAQISSIACPIGDVTLGKHPQAIAIGIAAALLKERRRAQTQPAPQQEETAI